MTISCKRRRMMKEKVRNDCDKEEYQFPNDNGVPVAMSCKGGREWFAPMKRG